MVVVFDFGNIFFMNSDLQNNYPKMFYTFANLINFKTFKLESNERLEGLPVSKYVGVLLHVALVLLA